MNKLQSFCVFSFFQALKILSFFFPKGFNYLFESQICQEKYLYPVVQSADGYNGQG